jgi:hypothetical protein
MEDAAPRSCGAWPVLARGSTPATTPAWPTCTRLASLRSVLPSAAWVADWRDAHDRLEDLRERVGDGSWNQALARVTDSDREIVTHLLNGVLDA